MFKAHQKPFFTVASTLLLRWDCSVGWISGMWNEMGPEYWRMLCRNNDFHIRPKWTRYPGLNGVDEAEKFWWKWTASVRQFTKKLTFVLWSVFCWHPSRNCNIWSLLWSCLLQLPLSQTTINLKYPLIALKTQIILANESGQPRRWSGSVSNNPINNITRRKIFHLFLLWPTRWSNSVKQETEGILVTRKNSLL